jgi:methylthioribose-1-phosphate isomerase
MTTRTPALPALADSVRLTEHGVEILDRRHFPFERRWVRCSTVEDVAVAIERMVTQSAGPHFAALQGMALAARELPADREAAREQLRAAGERLIATRPTNNLVRVGVTAVLEAVDGAESDLGSTAVEAAREAEQRYHDQCRRLGEHAAELLPDSGTVLTHCWADLYLIYTVLAAQQRGKDLRFFCTETRPYLQGARLTAETLAEMGVPTTLITDGMGASVLSRGLVDVLLTAADRVTLDGHVINKVGTLSLAVAAREFGVPYLALVPAPDPQAPTAESVPIEERDGDEVLHALGHRTASERVTGHYPAFDVTPPRLVTTVVTEQGPFRPDGLADYPKEQQDP